MDDFYFDPALAERLTELAETAERIAADAQPAIEAYESAQPVVDAYRAALDIADRVAAPAKTLADLMPLVEQIRAVLRDAKVTSADIAAARTITAQAVVAGVGGVWIKPMVVGGTGQVTIGDQDPVQPENINRMLRKAQRDGLMSLSCGQMITVILVCALLIGMPFWQRVLSPDAAAVLNEEVGDVALVIAIIPAILRNGRS